MRDFIDVTDLTKEEVLQIFEIAREIETKKLHKSKWCLLEDKVVTLAFFEPSTRTRLTFEVAAKRLCAHTMSVVGEEATSLMKGESLADTIRVLDTFSDVIVLRHKYEGASRYASEIANAPVINAGDGRRQHPTQTLIDLYTVEKVKGTIDDLVYAVVGDLRYARTANSFLLGLTLFKPRAVYLAYPPPLAPREEIIERLEEAGITLYVNRNIQEVLEVADVVYVTRIQRERLPDPREYEKLKGSYRITKDMLRKAKEGLIILHPLPRTEELDPAIDDTPYAAYFKQVESAVPIRMAILAKAVGVL